MVNASSRFAPSENIHSTGIFTSFQKEMQMASKPSIGRTLWEIRPITNADVGDGRFLVTALWKDDLPSVQRLLSSGLIRPWDED